MSQVRSYFAVRFMKYGSRTACKTQKLDEPTMHILIIIVLILIILRLLRS
jgi:hypothetical protein